MDQRDHDEHGTKGLRNDFEKVNEKRDVQMRAVFASAALAALFITPAFADFYIVQEPTTKRCRIVEERPTSPGIGVVIGGAGFGVRTEAESRMRIVEECRESGPTGGGVVIEDERERVRPR